MQNRPPSTDHERVSRLCDMAFGQDGPTVSTLRDVNQGRGAFSAVLLAELDWSKASPGAVAGPETVVAKLPIDGPNGTAAATAGAYTREALAYRELLPDSPVLTPQIHAIDEPGDDTCSLLMEDLSNHRAFDQLVGLPGQVAVAVAADLARFHAGWADDSRLATIPVRRNTIAGLAEPALSAGLAALDTTWADVLSDDDRAQYRRLLAKRDALVARFEAEPATLCHGDPRADNFVFDADDRMVLFDWQQMAVQFGEADLAWLSATSMEIDVRRDVEWSMVEAYGGRDERYRLGMALPGLTVLLLAQRQAGTERTRRFIAASLTRIAAALRDLEVASLV